MYCEEYVNRDRTEKEIQEDKEKEEFLKKMEEDFTKKVESGYENPPPTEATEIDSD